MSVKTEISGVRPFSNGSEADHWRGANCDRCQLNGYRDGRTPCPMEEAVALGYIVGTIPTELAIEYGATVRGDEEYITHPKRRAKPRCGKPAIGERTVRGYRYAVCEKHGKATS